MSIDSSERVKDDVAADGDPETIIDKHSRGLMRKLQTDMREAIAVNHKNITLSDEVFEDDAKKRPLQTEILHGVDPSADHIHREDSIANLKQDHPKPRTVYLSPSVSSTALKTLSPAPVAETEASLPSVADLTGQTINLDSNCCIIIDDEYAQCLMHDEILSFISF